VKTRIGFASTEEFDALLPIFARHSLDALTVHARTVAQMYRPPVHYDLIRRRSTRCRARTRQRRRPLGGAGAGAARGPAAAA
jgi:tRNA-dihydrouridine synthase